MLITLAGLQISGVDCLGQWARPGWWGRACCTTGRDVRYSNGPHCAT